MEIASDKAFSTVNQDKRSSFKIFSTLQNSNAVNLKYLSIDIFLASLAKHNHILGAVHKLRSRGGGGGGLSKWLEYYIGAVQDFITVYHESGGNTREISSPTIFDNNFPMITISHGWVGVGGPWGSPKVIKPFMITRTSRHINHKPSKQLVAFWCPLFSSGTCLAHYCCYN